MHVAHMFLKRFLASEFFPTKLARNTFCSTSTFMGSKLERIFWIEINEEYTYVFDMFRENTAIAADSLTIFGARTGRRFRRLRGG